MFKSKICTVANEIPCDLWQNFYRDNKSRLKIELSYTDSEKVKFSLFTPWRRIGVLEDRTIRSIIDYIVVLNIITV